MGRWGGCLAATAAESEHRRFGRYFHPKPSSWERPIDGGVPRPRHTTQPPPIDCYVFASMMLGGGGQRWPQSARTIIDRIGDFSIAEFDPTEPVVELYRQRQPLGVGSPNHTNQWWCYWRRDSYSLGVLERWLVLTLHRLQRRWITEVAHLGVGPVLPMVIAQWRNGVRRSSAYR